jgi:hypothetical protein
MIFFVVKWLDLFLSGGINEKAALPAGRLFVPEMILS